MRLHVFILALAGVAAVGAIAPAFAQSAPAPAARAPAGQPPADPWPRVVDLDNGQVPVYPPQASCWEGNRIDFRSALAIKPSGAQGESFGVTFANA
jgi:hypothetical protein